MKKQEEQIEEEAVVKKPWVPSVVVGGKDGGGMSGGPDWLRDLPVGSAFFAQDNQANNSREEKYFSLAGPFMISYRTPNGRGCGLVMETPNGGQALIPVDSMRFSGRYKLYDILHFGDGNDIKKEQLEAPEGDKDDGHSEGTVQS